MSVSTDRYNTDLKQLSLLLLLVFLPWYICLMLTLNGYHDLFAGWVVNAFEYYSLLLPTVLSISSQITGEAGDRRESRALSCFPWSICAFSFLHSPKLWRIWTNEPECIPSLQPKRNVLHGTIPSSTPTQCTGSTAPRNSLVRPILGTLRWRCPETRIGQVDSRPFFRTTTRM